jgi:hypothetical protein
VTESNYHGSVVLKLYFLFTGKIFMHYVDTIYGNHEIQEPVILELINSPAMQRLKGIDQA